MQAMHTLSFDYGRAYGRCLKRRVPVLFIGMLYALSLLSVQAADRQTRSYNTELTIDPAVEVVYRLSAFDLLKITVYGQDDLYSERISDKGMLSVPLLGEISVGGLTVSEAAKRIEHAFVAQQYLRHPIVTISILDFAPKVVTVLGEVESPGSVEIPPGRNGIPVQIAIAGAGGFSGTAKSSEVRVTRATAQKGKPLSEVVNVDKLLKTKGSRSSTLACSVHPDDVVFVPRRVF
jgi:protein involved in polysaccharide export with SLBB domain